MFPNNLLKKANESLATDLSLILVGMVKQPSEHSSEFQMSNEDFPALPGAPASFVFSDQSGVLDSVKINAAQLTPEQELAKSAQARKGIQTSPNGESWLDLVFNYPANVSIHQAGSNTCVFSVSLCARYW